MNKDRHLQFFVVGEVGADPTIPIGSGFMVLETRIELEIYVFENLDYF